MDVTTCLQYGGKKILITVDGEPWREVSCTVFGKELTIPQCLDGAELEEAFVKIEYKQAFNYALRLLGSRAYLTQQLRQRMRRQGVSESAIRHAVEMCQSYGYLDDEEWVRSFVRQRVSLKDGPQKIAASLREKGVAKDFYEAILASECQREDQDGAIVRLLATRYRGRNLMDYKERQKIIAALLRKGFPFEAINEALNKHSDSKDF